MRLYAPRTGEEISSRISVARYIESLCSILSSTGIVDFTRYFLA